MSKLVPALQLATILGLACVLVFGSLDREDIRSDLAKLESRLSALEAAPAPRAGEGGGSRAGAIEGRIAENRRDLQNVLKAMKFVAEDIDSIKQDFEFLAVDVDAVKRNTWELLKELKETGRISEEPEPPDEYRQLFDPETRGALAGKASEMGVRLLEDRVEVPGVIIQDRVMLEFVAVVTGGKEHEAIVALTGSFDPKGERLPEGLAGMINACILALGYQRGTPISYVDGNVVPPQGATIHVYVEWEGEDGKTVRARAEDLVYDLETKAAMQRDVWVYVGSRFERDFGGAGTVYMADVTGDVVATYSWPNTIIDNTSLEAKDDIYYVCYTPRIPPIGTKVTMVFSKEPLPAKEFPADEFGEDDGGDSDK